MSTIPYNSKNKLNDTYFAYNNKEIYFYNRNLNELKINNWQRRNLNSNKSINGQPLIERKIETSSSLSSLQNPKTKYLQFFDQTNSCLRLQNINEDDIQNLIKFIKTSDDNEKLLLSLRRIKFGNIIYTNSFWIQKLIKCLASSKNSNKLRNLIMLSLGNISAYNFKIIKLPRYLQFFSCKDINVANGFFIGKWPINLYSFSCKDISKCTNFILKKLPANLQFFSCGNIGSENFIGINNIKAFGDRMVYKPTTINFPELPASLRRFSIEKCNPDTIVNLPILPPAYIQFICKNPRSLFESYLKEIKPLNTIRKQVILMLSIVQYLES